MYHHVTQLAPTVLKPHPRNKEFFDDMSGDKWKEFLESVKTSGIIEPIVITQDNVVVSGHQRLRAAKELNLETVPTIMKTYYSEDEILKDLLETNVRQRGSINTSSVKSAVIISTLEKIYKGDKSGTTPNNQKELANKLGVSLRTLQYIKQLDKLPDELKLILEDGKITSSTGLKIMEKLSEDEQKLVINMIQSSDKDKVTSKEISKYVEELRQKDLEIAKLNNKLNEVTSNEGSTNQSQNTKSIAIVTDDDSLLKNNSLKNFSLWTERYYKVLLQMFGEDAEKIGDTINENADVKELKRLRSNLREIQEVIRSVVTSANGVINE